MEATGLTKVHNNPVSAALYTRLLTELDRFATYDVEVKQTSLHIAHGKAFLGVHPRRGGLLLTIVTQSPLESPRLKKVERVSAHRFHNEIELQSEQDFDAELLGWMKQAYALTA